MKSSSNALKSVARTIPYDICVLYEIQFMIQSFDTNGSHSVYMEIPLFDITGSSRFVNVNLLNAGPTLKQQWANASCLLGYYSLYVTPPPPPLRSQISQAQYNVCR